MLSAVVITKNEEKNIKMCLGALSFADEIVVVDSGSSDCTIELARHFTSKVMTRTFDNFASQKNFAVSQASGDWIFSVDADEVVSTALADEIKSKIKKKDIAAYRVRRKTNFFGRDFKASGLQSDAPVRLFQKNLASFQNPVHEIVLVKGEIHELRETLSHRSFQTIGEHLKKLQLYTSIEAKQCPLKNTVRGLDWLRPLARFWSIYIWRAGFRDGLEGFLYAVLSSYYEFVRWIKKWEGAAR